MFQQILKKKRGGVDFYISTLSHVDRSDLCKFWHSSSDNIKMQRSKLSHSHTGAILQSFQKSQIVKRLQMNHNQITLTRQQQQRTKTIPRFNLTERSPRAHHREGAVLHCVQQRSLRVAENSRSGTHSASQATFFVKIKRRIKNYITTNFKINIFYSIIICEAKWREIDMTQKIN